VAEPRFNWHWPEGKNCTINGKTSLPEMLSGRSGELFENGKRVFRKELVYIYIG